MKVTITLDLYDEAADPGDATGVTEDAFLGINEALSEYGEDIQISQ